MSQINLKVQIHCLQPSWVGFENNRYRLYLNKDMLTERSWIWDTKTYIDESIYVELESDLEHSIKIIPILDPTTSLAKFAIKNLRIENQLYPIENQNQLELSFKL